MKTILKKGEFAITEANNFVSLVQYLIVLEDDSKYLLLRLRNNTNQRVDGLVFAIGQMDKDGKEINSLTIDCKASGKANSTFVTDKLAMLNDCEDVQVEIVSINLCGRIYTPLGKLVTKDLGKNNNLTDGGRIVTVPKSKLPRTFFCIVLAAMILSCFALYLQLHFYKESNDTFFHMGVRYAFINTDKSKDSSIYVTGVESGATDIVIPKKIKEHTVVKIMPYAFDFGEELRSVTINAPISISSGLFNGCDNLTTVTLNEVIEIESNAFNNCLSLTTFNARDLVVIRSGAFSNCDKLNTISISSDEYVLYVENNAFSKCDSLRTIEIDQFIDYSAVTSLFEECNMVTTLRLKNYNYSFELGGVAFEGTKNNRLAALFVQSDLGWLSNVVIDYCDTIPNYFCRELNLQALTINNLTTPKIGNYAFFGCARLMDFNIPYALEDVGDFAFYATGIKVFDGKDLTKIGQYAFAYCSRLSFFDLEDNLTLQEIGEGAFVNCSELKRIYIPKDISIIRAKTFEYCTKLWQVSAGGVISMVESNAFNNCWSLTTVPLDNAISIGTLAFGDCYSIDSISFSQSLKIIEDFAFSHCTNLVSVAIPKGITKIGLGAFGDCSSLREIALPYAGGTYENGFLAYIFGADDYTMYDKVPKSLKKITILEARRVEQGAFFGCRWIETVSFESPLESIGAAAFYNCMRLREFTIPVSLTEIGHNAFASCFKLYEIYNLSSLPIACGQTDFGSIGYYALWVYRSLSEEKMPKLTQDDFEFAQSEGGDWYATDYTGQHTSIEFPHVVYYNSAPIGSYAIIKHMIIDDKSINRIVVGGQVTEIGEYAFDCKMLEYVSVPISVQSIGRGAFFSCRNITEMHLPFVGGTLYSNNYLGYVFDEEYDDLYGNPSTLQRLSIARANFISDYAFYGCSGLIDLDLPQSYSHIGSYAFAFCFMLESFEVPDSVTSIGYGAFESCNSLLDITLPFIGQSKTQNRNLAYIFGAVAPLVENVVLTQGEDIDTYAFAGCYGLSSISLPDSITTIAASAFESCHALSEIILPASLDTIGENAFAYCASLRRVVLKSKVSIKENAFSECSKLYEIYNLGGMSLQKGSTANGGIAYCAVVIYSSLSESKMNEIRIDDFVFLNRGNYWVLIDYSSDSDNLHLGSFVYQGQTILAYDIASRAINSSVSDLTIGNEVKNILNRAFFWTNIKNVKFVSSDISVINSQVFAWCGTLESVELPQKLEIIGESAFDGCFSLYSILIPKGVTAIGENAFLGCKKLFDVANQSNLIIQKGSTQNGYIGYYALRVDNSANVQLMETVEQDGYRFAFFESQWYMLVMPDTSILSFPKSFFTRDGEEIDSYIVMETAFAYSSRLSIFIPLSVAKIVRTVAYTPHYIYEIFFEGSKQQWEQITQDLDDDWRTMIVMVYHYSE